MRILLAEAISNPEHLLKLADAAETTIFALEGEAAIAGAELDAYRDQLARTEADRARYARVLALLDPVTDANDVREYRDRVTALNEDHAKLTAAIAAATPRRDRAIERQALLRAVSAYHRFGINFSTGETWDDGVASLATSIDEDVARSCLASHFVTQASSYTSKEVMTQTWSALEW